MTFGLTGRTLFLLAALATLVGCGPSGARPNAAGSAGSSDVAVPDSTELGSGDAGATETSAVVREFGLLLGIMAFNEPDNEGFARDLVPSWNSDGLTFTSAGRLTGAVTLTAAGPLPAADQSRDVLFWNVVGEFPDGGDAQFLPLSPIDGVVASASTPSTATFAVDGGFDLGVRGADGRTAQGLAFALTWVRVLRTGAAFQYQVLPGWRDAGDGAFVPWDRSTGPVSGPLGYYAPVSASPALGSSFDYPSWVTAHVTWQ